MPDLGGGPEEIQKKNFEGPSLGKNIFGGHSPRKKFFEGYSSGKKKVRQPLSEEKKKFGDLFAGGKIF